MGTGFAGWNSLARRVGKKRSDFEWRYEFEHGGGLPLSQR